LGWSPLSKRSLKQGWKGKILIFLKKEFDKLLKRVILKTSSTNGGKMKYEFDYNEYQKDYSGESTDNFLEYLQKTDVWYFIDEEENSYFDYVKQETIESYVDYKRGYSKRLLIIQEKETKEYYGIEYTVYNQGETYSGSWEKYNRVRTRPVVYKYRVAA